MLEPGIWKLQNNRWRGVGPFNSRLRRCRSGRP